VTNARQLADLLSSADALLARTVEPLRPMWR